MTQKIENGDKVTMHERIAVIETKLNTILMNHLPHINIKLNWLIGLIFTTMIGIIYILTERILSHI